MLVKSGPFVLLRHDNAWDFIEGLSAKFKIKFKHFKKGNMEVKSISLVLLRHNRAWDHIEGPETITTEF